MTINPGPSWPVTKKETPMSNDDHVPTSPDAQPSTSPGPEGMNWLRLLPLLPPGEYGVPFVVGTNVYIRTVAYHCTGCIAAFRGQWVYLRQAAYVANDGRFSVATEQGVQHHKDSEIEMVGGPGLLAVNMNSIADVCIHPGDLPSETK